MLGPRGRRGGGRVERDRARVMGNSCRWRSTGTNLGTNAHRWSDRLGVVPGSLSVVAMLKLTREMGGRTIMQSIRLGSSYNNVPIVIIPIKKPRDILKRVPPPEYLGNPTILAITAEILVGREQCLLPTPRRQTSAERRWARHGATTAEPIGGEMRLSIAPTECHHCCLDSPEK